jgi:hypothetical protein
LEDAGRAQLLLASSSDPHLDDVEERLLVGLVEPDGRANLDITKPV